MAFCQGLIPIIFPFNNYIKVYIFCNMSLLTSSLFLMCYLNVLCNWVVMKALDVIELPHTWTGPEHKEELQIWASHYAWSKIWRHSMIWDFWVLFTLGIIAFIFSGNASLPSSPPESSLCERWRVALGSFPWACCHYFTGRIMVQSWACYLFCFCLLFLFCSFSPPWSGNSLIHWKKKISDSTGNKTFGLITCILVVFNYSLGAAEKPEMTWFYIWFKSHAGCCGSQDWATKQEVITWKSLVSKTHGSQVWGRSRIIKILKTCSN